MTNADRWTPVRKGRIYCSPGCGYNCTWDDYQEAIKAADALAKQLGPNWQPRVWENGGWHHSVYLIGDDHRRGIQVYPTLDRHITPHRLTGYHAFLRTPTAIDIGADAATPEKAVEAVMEEFASQVTHLQSLLNTYRHDHYVARENECV